MPNIIETIAIFAKLDSPLALGAVLPLMHILKKNGYDVVIEQATAELLDDTTPYSSMPTTDMHGKVHLALVLGGDGTMLGAARKLAPYGIPLVGINHGRLGFLTDLCVETAHPNLKLILEGQGKKENRSLLSGSLLRQGTTIADHIALNDIFIHKGPTGRMIEFELLIDKELVCTQRSDGMIVCTPTGSTGYALAANGPILHPSLNGIGLIPLCPHSLTNRPVVLSDDVVITIRLLHTEVAQMHFDGQYEVALSQGDEVSIRRSEHTACFLHPPEYHYFSMLRSKLHWR